MEKELPRVYQHPVNHDTNKKVAMTKSGEQVHQTREHRISTRSIEQKIIDVFNSVNYIYKVDVVLKRNGKEEEKQLVGRNKDYLITMENEKIAIRDIEDIYLQ